jgi:PDZ domain-containing protein
VRQKVYAARDAGAEYVLVPADNYDDALEAAEGDIEVLSIATIDDALRFLDALEPSPALQASQG